MVPPGSAWYTPARILMSVDLPEPFPPTSAWISPGSTVRSTSTSARVPTKVLLRWVRRRAGTATAGPPSAPLIDAPGWAPMSGALGSRLAPGLLVRGLEVHGRYEITGGGDVVFRVGQGPTDAGVSRLLTQEQAVEGVDRRPADPLRGDDVDRRDALLGPDQVELGSEALAAHHVQAARVGRGRDRGRDAQQRGRRVRDLHRVRLGVLKQDRGRLLLKGRAELGGLEVHRGHDAAAGA